MQCASATTAEHQRGSTCQRIAPADAGISESDRRSLQPVPAAAVEQEQAGGREAANDGIMRPSKQNQHDVLRNNGTLDAGEEVELARRAANPGPARGNKLIVEARAGKAQRFDHPNEVAASHTAPGRPLPVQFTPRPSNFQQFLFTALGPAVAHCGREPDRVHRSIGC